MPGIYIHIPFCRKACHYCNFHFSTSLHHLSDLMQALHQEIDIEEKPGRLPQPTTFETLYLGGGSPSIVDTDLMASLMEKLAKKYYLAQDAEITLEANPDDINTGKLHAWKALGFNRLSIGIQSFRNEDLQWMNRAHTARQALDAIDMARAAGFENLNIDLIYGTPTLPPEAWMNNLDQARQLGITHLSCYALTVEENTALHHFIRKGRVLPPPEEEQARQFEILTDWAVAYGWEHYEISNLCLPGHRSRHNTAYWTGRPYLGFGPSAHSFDGMDTRWMGIANNALYIQAWQHGGRQAYEVEKLSPIQRVNEKIMTGLRRLEGIQVVVAPMEVEGFYPEPAAAREFLKIMAKYAGLGYCMHHQNRLYLTPAGRLHADAIAADLFFATT